MTRPLDLPEYNSPPIDEVAIGLQFEPLEDISEAHIGLFWQSLRESFPKTESKPRFEVPIETFSSDPQILTPQVTITPMKGMLGRTWLISENEDYLIQVQNTHIVHNWRRRDSEYPRFDPLKKKFWETYDRFCEILSSEQLKSPTLTQIELTYINWITDMTMSEFFRPAGAAEIEAKQMRSQAEDQLFLARYVAEDEKGNPFGRLHIHCQEAIHQESNARGNLMSLIFRVPVFPEWDRKQLDEALELGRNVIVRSFTNLTTEQAQQRWERLP